MPENVAYPGLSSYTFLSNNVTAILTDPNGHIWLGTKNRVMYAFDPQKLPPDPVEAKAEHYEAFPINSAQPRMVDSRGYLWASTNADGIVRVNLQTREMQQWTTRDGLSHNKTYGVVEDNRGRIWIGTFNGLSCFDPATEKFRNFYTTDGLPTNTIDGTMPCKGPDGELYFHTSTDGIVHFHPDDLERASILPEVAFTGLSIFDEEVPIGGESPLQQHISLTKKVTLTHDQRDVVLQFAALHSVNPQKQTYRAMLENYDAGWRNMGRERMAKYTNLSPGSYTFKVKASDSNGNWPEGFTSLELEILPPWWQTWWAYLLYSVAFVGSAYGLYRYQVNRKLQAADMQRLKELNDFKARFYTNITHEFRTPLTVIAGKQARHESEQLRRQGSMVQRNARSLLSLVNQLLDLSKIESGSLELHLRQADVVPFVRYVSRPFEMMARDKGLEFRWESRVGALPMDFDAEKLQQVVSNLLSNAVKFTDGGSITLSLSKREEPGGGHFCLEVADTGVGIPAGQLPHIFELFYQADNSTTREHEGSGVGLALCRDLVRLMDGQITAESKGGEGTLFRVVLPVTRNAPALEGGNHFDRSEWAAAEEVPRQPAENGHAPANGKDVPRQLVLVVEDNPDLREYLRECLETEYRLLFAENGEQGLSKALKQLPDLIISDVMMPKMDGFQMAHQIRQDDRTAHIPLIFLTAKATTADRLAGLKLGADAYLTKPFDKGELLLVMGRQLELRDQLRERYAALGPYPPAEDLATQKTDNFLLKFNRILGENLQDSRLSVTHLASEMGMSRSQLHRKLVSVTGIHTTGYIARYRLEKSRALLQERPEMSIAEVAYEVGFSDPNYFSRCFKKEYDQRPTEYRDGV